MTLNNYQLKVLAVLLMLVDHVGFVFFPNIATFRVIGRFSFPIFLFLLVQGEKYTRNFKQYCLRLLLFGIVSQPIHEMLLGAGRYNILFTLLLGLLCLRLVRRFPQWQILIWLVGVAIAELFDLGYGAYGVLALVLIRYIRVQGLWWVGWIALHLSLLSTPSVFSFQAPAILAPVLLHFANHQPGRKARWVYLSYPVHLFALWLLRRILTT